MEKLAINLASVLEYTLLKPDTTRADIERICREAILLNLRGVCLPPYFVSHAHSLLDETGIKLITVIGFPMGYSTVNAKGEETRKAIADGADEIDVVLNISALKSGNNTYVKDDLERITTLCRLSNKVSKAIIEATLLTEDELMLACEICVAAGADYVKTSTGFHGSTDEEMVKHIRALLPPKMKIKASGGIRTRDQVERLLAAGADRIGTSSALEIVEG